MRPDQSFFAQPTLDIAKQLLGMELIHETEAGVCAGKIVEVEAYRGPLDKAAHSYGGRKTKRTLVMYGPAGHVYMFRIYGMHICFNIVTAEPGHPEAILIRALEPTQGIPLMKKKRGVADLKSLTNGPAKLCQALSLSMDHYGHLITEAPLYLEKNESPLLEANVIAGPRINIDYAEEAKDYPWRFWIRDNPFVSK